MAVISISTLFGDPATLGGNWERPVHETANRCFILPGATCCICVPQTASRVVVEMWGQGGGGGGSCCCQWPSSGGQGGSYAYKVWSGAISPQTLGTNFSFCGCVCTCDCKSYDACGSPGQFSRLCMCNSSNWIGCVTGGTGGCSYCTTFSWYCCSGYSCRPAYDMCGLVSPTTTVNVQTRFFGTHAGVSQMGVSCICDASFICLGASACVPIGWCMNTSDQSLPSTSSSFCTINELFPIQSCSCWDIYRLGACGFSVDVNSNCSLISGYTSLRGANRRIGFGGAAYAGGRMQPCTCNPETDTWCGFGGNFPGGGGRGSAACGGGCCMGSYGGGGLILISWV